MLAVLSRVSFWHWLKSNLGSWVRNEPKRILQKHHEKREIQFCLERKAAFTRGVMLWVSNSYGRSLSAFFEEFSRLHPQCSRTSCDTIPLAPRKLNFSSVQCYTCIEAVTTKFFHNSQVTVFPWQVRTPDLSQIEHVWDMIRIGSNFWLHNLFASPKTLSSSYLGFFKNILITLCEACLRELWNVLT